MKHSETNQEVGSATEAKNRKIFLQGRIVDIKFNAKTIELDQKEF